MPAASVCLLPVFEHAKMLNSAATVPAQAYEKLRF
jgi:hypothetical protein